MFSKHMKQTILLLVLASAVIYILQILIFKDPSTTAFYIFQDMAFIPISVALTTVILGTYIDERDKKERAENTRMLTSTFFTQVGAKLMNELIGITDNREELKQIHMNSRNGSSDTAAMMQHVKQMDPKVSVDAVSYAKIVQMVHECQPVLLILSSNPMILEQKDFTNMLWGIFHLEDEFQLRGSYEELSEEDIEHINEDLSRVLVLLFTNSIPNGQYLRETYPNFYRAARSKVKEAAKKVTSEKNNEVCE